MSHCKLVLGRGDGAVSEWDPSGRASPLASTYRLGQRTAGVGGNSGPVGIHHNSGESGFATIKKKARDPVHEEPAGACVERVTINALQWGEVYRGQDKSRRFATVWEPRCNHTLMAQTVKSSDIVLTGNHRPLQTSTASGDVYRASPAGVHGSTLPNKNVGSHSAEIHSWIDAQPRQGAVRPKHWADTTSLEPTTINDTFYKQRAKL